MTELIKLNDYPVKDVLKKLLQDKTTKRNIIFATDTYEGYVERTMMTDTMIHGFDSCEIQPRVYKSAAEQGDRTRKKAEVFTPAWIVNKMNNHLDSEWFGKTEVFNSEKDLTWMTNSDPITFPEGKDWKSYVDSRRLEITCGEAPYIVSRYDSTTGNIIPLNERIGLLDRKLRIVNENASDDNEWLKWSIRALQSVYGYEFQGDNLLIARINVLNTYCDYYEERFKKQADKRLLEKVSNIISWNFWQMNGINDSLPYEGILEQYEQIAFFEINEPDLPCESDCKVYDWRKDTSRYFKTIKKRGKGMKFDYVIGNPPYQDEKKSDSPRDLPVYDKFMDASYAISNKVMLITPARFLFNAGFTSKEWNFKMLNDNHLKVLFFESESRKVFKNAQIPGGVAITYHDNTKDFGKIGAFVPFPELYSIINKCKSEHVMTELISSRDLFHYSDFLFQKHPEKKAINNNNNVVNSNAFDKFEDIFTEKPTRSDDIVFLGRYNSKRAYRYILKEYIEYNPYISQNKVVFAQTNGGAGTITDEKAAAVMGKPTISYEMSGFTDSFICIGLGEDRKLAENCAKYIHTKFMRALLASLKRTGSITKDKWSNVPIQDFSSNSDIDWSKSVAEIDKQLYAKYGLSQDEINFIEDHVKEME